VDAFPLYESCLESWWEWMTAILDLLSKSELVMSITRFFSKGHLWTDWTYTSGWIEEKDLQARHRMSEQVEMDQDWNQNCIWHSLRMRR
jgi:hypothetical protein